jgi:hypothetical protein
MSDALAEIEKFRSSSFEPVSFRERGATVPFTTPLLLNARIRRAASGHGLEMVVINPSGGRGALIMPWGAMPEICAPTLFDRYLWESLNEADDISPISVRHRAQRLAAQGLAGRQATIAAKDAERRERASIQLMRTMLQESLIAASERPAEAAGRPNAPEGEAFKRRADRAVERSAAIAGMPLADFSRDLEKLAISLSGATPQIEGEDARLRQMLESLTRVSNEITDWIASEQAEATHIQAARFIEQTARQTIECAEFALAATDVLIADLGLLLPKWRQDKEAILERARAPDWVLDGWKTPMGIWQAAAPNQRRTAIWEMALIAPILPREAKAWLSDVGELRETPRRTTQIVRDRADWRNGSVMDMVARNEDLISFSIAYENRIAPLERPRNKVNLPQLEAKTRLARKELITKFQGEAAAQRQAVELPKTNSAEGKRNVLLETRALGSLIEGASDEALSRIVALVDRMSNSDFHERLLGRALPRLKRLRPPRPASLMRLLFLPLSGALVDPLQWRRNEGRIPRSAIAPLTESLKLPLGPQAEAIQVELRGGSLEDPKLVQKTGFRLWNLAAEAVPRMSPGASWARAGLNEADFDQILTLAGGLWRHGNAIWEGMRQIGTECTPEILFTALRGPAHEGRPIFAAAIDTLLQRAARPSVFMAIDKDMPSGVSGIIEEAMDNWLHATLPSLMEEELATAARLVAEAGAVLELLEKLPRITARIAAKDLVSHRRNLEQTCRSLYREVVAVHMTQALEAAKNAPSEALGEMESLARTARSLEDTGRRFGTPQSYMSIQQDFRVQLNKLSDDGDESGLSTFEIARIEEILVGREAAEIFILRQHRSRRKI